MQVDGIRHAPRLILRSPAPASRYAVGQRTREIGIRAARGADARRVIRMVLGDNLRAVVVGLAAGLALSIPVGMASAGMLYRVSPFDPAVLLAAWMPARRAARVDPMMALRSE